MADHDLRPQLEPLRGDDPSPEVVDAIWRRLDAELTGDAPSVVGGREEFQMVQVDARAIVSESGGREFNRAGGVAAVLLLVVAGLLVVLRDGNGEDEVSVAADPTATTPASPPTTAASPSRTAGDGRAEPGPVEQLLTVFFAEGIEAAASSELAAPDLVYGPGGEDDPGETWFTWMAGYFTDPDLELECVAQGQNSENCLVEAEVPLSRVLDRRGQVLIGAFIDSDGRVANVATHSHSERRMILAYQYWLEQHRPEITGACDEVLAACFTDELVDEFVASEDFVDHGARELSLP